MEVEDIIQTGLTAYIIYLVFQAVSYLLGLATLGIFILVIWSLIVGC